LFTIETPIDSTIGKKYFNEIAQSILDEQHPGDHNQAIMEFGALVCTPKQPKCTECPLQSVCLAFEKKNVLNYPVKKGKTIQKERFFNYFHIEQNGYTYVKKRDNSDVWKNLYEFPLIETEEQNDLLKLQENSGFSNLFHSVGEIYFQHKLRLKHILSHRIIHADFYRVELGQYNIFDIEKKFIKIKSASLFEYPVSRLIHKYLEII